MTDNEIIKCEELEDVLYDELKAALDNYASERELKEYYQFGDGKLRYMAGFLIHNGWTLNRLKRLEDKLIQNNFELINRQKVEIARLKTQLSKSKEFFTFTLDREQLVAIVKSQFEKIEVDAATVRNDAIREFATKLKQQVDFVYRPGGYRVLSDVIEVINALVEEMTEGQDNG